MTDLARRLRHIPPDTLEQLRLDGSIGAVARNAIGEALGAQKPERKPSRDDRLEAEIRMDLRAWCKAQGAAFIVDNEQNRKTRVTEGLSDLIVFWGDERGITYIECKRPGEKQTMAQRMFQVAVEASGGVYILARSVEDLERWADNQWREIR